MNDGVKLGIFSVLIFGAAYGLSFAFSLPLLLLLILSVYFSGFTFLLNRQLSAALQHENKNKFTQVFMGLTGIKIFSSLILLALSLFFFKDNRLYIGICIMCYYMLYTAYEVIFWRSRLAA